MSSAAQANYAAVLQALSTRRDVTRATARGVPVASLLLAAQAADVALLRELLSAGWPNGRSALAEAAMLQAVLKPGADKAALLDSSLLVVKALLKAGSDTRLRDVTHLLPIKGVAITGDLRVADAILAAERARGIPLVDDESTPDEADWLRGVAAAVEAFRAGGAPLLPEQLRQQNLQILDGVGMGTGAVMDAATPDARGTAVHIMVDEMPRRALEQREVSVAGVHVAMGAQEAVRCDATGCGAAGAGALRMCAACHTVRYCSTACQRTHWPEHKRACKAAQAKKRGGAAR